MIHYQSLFDKHYKPPSLDMLERRLTEIAKGGVPVCIACILFHERSGRDAKAICGG